MTTVIVATIIGTVIAGLILDALTDVRPKVVAYFKTTWNQHDRNEAADQESRMKTLREQVVETAQKNGQVLRVKSSGRRPTVIHNSDGTSDYYFSGDLPAYKKALASGRAPLQRSHLTPPPQKTVHSWSEDELLEWLDQNA